MLLQVGNNRHLHRTWKSHITALFCKPLVQLQHTYNVAGTRVCVWERDSTLQKAACREKENAFAFSSFLSQHSIIIVLFLAISNIDFFAHSGPSRKQLNYVQDTCMTHKTYFVTKYFCRTIRWRGGDDFLRLPCLSVDVAEDTTSRTKYDPCICSTCKDPAISVQNTAFYKGKHLDG